MDMETNGNQFECYPVIVSRCQLFGKSERKLFRVGDGMC